MFMKDTYYFCMECGSIIRVRTDSRNAVRVDDCPVCRCDGGMLFLSDSLEEVEQVKKLWDNLMDITKRTSFKDETYHEF